VVAIPLASPFQVGDATDRRTHQLNSTQRGAQQEAIERNRSPPQRRKRCREQFPPRNNRELLEKLYEKHHVSKERADFIQECDAIAGVLSQFIVRLRKNKVHLLQEKTFEMYRLLSSRSGLIKDITIDDKTYEVRITDRNGHEIKKSGLSAGEKEVFAVSLLWGLAQTSQLKLPIIIDTPLSRLDSTQRDNIVNNYFPNAGEQVVILSTDTEIDKDYYRALKARLSGAGSLEFDQRQELTTFREGYFWEK
jgi:DNA sulfur modification protein DndD